MTILSAGSTSTLSQIATLLQQVYQNTIHKKDAAETDSKPSDAVSSTSAKGKNGFVAGSPSMSGNNMSVLLAAQSVTATEASSSQTATTNNNSDSAALAQAFTVLDADGDGKISKDEFVSARPEGTTTAQATSLFASIDTESTGSITKTQWESALTKALGDRETTGRSSFAASSSVVNNDGSVSTTATSFDPYGLPIVTITTLPSNNQTSLTS